MNKVLINGKVVRESFDHFFHEKLTVRPATVNRIISEGKTAGLSLPQVRRNENAPLFW